MGGMINSTAPFLEAELVADLQSNDITTIVSVMPINNPPSTAPDETLQLFPRVTYSSRTTLEPIFDPSPILQFGPIWLKGPISISAPSSAEGSMMALG